MKSLSRPARWPRAEAGSVRSVFAPGGQSARTTAVARIVLIVLLVGSLSLTAYPAAALHYLEPEESISALLVELTADAREQKKRDEEAGRRWAIVPQIGYGPETSVVLGAKFTDRNFLSTGATFDVDGVYALEGQQAFAVGFASPTSIGPDFPIVVRAQYKDDPRRRFFGLGNNTQGPDPASSHELQRFGGDVTLGWRVLNNLCLNLQAGGWRGNVREGDQIDDEPPTIVRFPDLPGIDGATMVPLAVSLVYDERRGITRPTQGWRLLLKASYDVGDLRFARVLGDVSYLHPFFGNRLILGARLGGHWIPNHLHDVPFWALADLGGEYTLRGYFPYRFLGTSAVLSTVEARAKLFEFDLFTWWHVVVDGVGFGEIGRVFIEQRDLAFQGDTSDGLRQSDHVPVSYGAGLRFAMSDAILARVDVGFSDEETALVYLTFGHTF